MNPEALVVLIPVVAIGGFFTWLITRTLTRAYTAKLEAQGQAGAAPGMRNEDVLASLEELRREVAELAERVDFAERLLAKPRDAEGGKLQPGGRRTAST